MKQRSAEWFAARKGRITGSRVGAILGLSPWQTPDDVLRAMVREHHGASSEFTGNVATQWGIDHEPLAALDYMHESGNDVTECGLIVHPAHDWLGASPDGLVGTQGIVEYKCPYGLRDDPSPVFKGISETEQPHYYAQIQCELFCAERDWCDFVQWTPLAMHMDRVLFCERWWAESMLILEAFYRRYLSELDNPDHLEDNKPVEVNTDLSKMLLEQYDDAKGRAEAAKEEMTSIIERLATLTSEKNAIIHGRKFTHVERAGSVSYAKIVAKHLPDLDLDEYRGKPTKFWKLS